MVGKISSILRYTARIAAAYVGRNSLVADEVTQLISEIHGALSVNLTADHTVQCDPSVKNPTMNPKRLVRSDFIICLEDGKPFKSMKRHLKACHGLTPEQYREKWNLPKDHPVVAPSYAGLRSKIAKQAGLGCRQNDGRNQDNV
ncbi:MucR family transcriptional regulator [Brucella pituitosa]|uniref:MucR family transcriptional regulator n=1 Tax=Brucella pituitosa TaxID=571256 RepID=UPI0009A19E86|nr:MucR family transcriptional regulator [Brucella pituitosa]